MARKSSHNFSFLARIKTPLKRQKWSSILLFKNGCDSKRISWTLYCYCFLFFYCWYILKSFSTSTLRTLSPLACKSPQISAHTNSPIFEAFPPPNQQIFKAFFTLHACFKFIYFLSWFKLILLFFSASSCCHWIAWDDPLVSRQFYVMLWRVNLIFHCSTFFPLFICYAMAVFVIACVLSSTFQWTFFNDSHFSCVILQGWHLIYTSGRIVNGHHYSASLA